MRSRFILAALPVFLLTACSDIYRYPCQDPDNWQEKICQKPYCSANGTCPDDLNNYEKRSTAPVTKSLAPAVKGDSKC